MRLFFPISSEYLLENRSRKFFQGRKISLQNLANFSFCQKRFFSLTLLHRADYGIFSFYQTAWELKLKFRKTSPPLPHPHPPMDSHPPEMTECYCPEEPLFKNTLGLRIEIKS
jgi:hypothetical protein